MQSLIWCFLSFRGRLTRQQFALAFFFLAAIAYVVGKFVTGTMIGPTNNGRAWSENDLLMAQLEAQMLASVLMFWPSLAIQVKRLRDIGYSWIYLVAVNVLLGIAMVFAPFAAMIVALIAALFLFFAKGKKI